jgi:hypothetical protein
MAKQKTAARAGDKNRNGHRDEPESYEQELAEYLQERIKPNLNSGAIPLLARSIARDLARRELPEDAQPDEELEGEADEEFEDEPEEDVEGEADEDFEDDADEDEDEDAEGDADEDFEEEEEANLQADLQELQAELGEEWIVRFSVQGDYYWLTAEKEDGSQRLEAPSGAVLADAVEVLNGGGEE